MKKLLLSFRAVLAISALLISSSLLAQTRVVGYLPTWTGLTTSINNVDLSTVTHINVSFANPSSTSGAISTPSGTSTVVQQAHAKNVKVLISIAGGGGNGSIYYGILSNATNTTNFINNLVQMTQGPNGVDGIDVDIEGGIFTAGVTPAMYENFVVKLAAALKAKGKLITCAIATSYGSYITTNAIQQYDFVNIMSYDKYGPWSGPGQHSTYQMAVDDIAYWNKKGVAFSKLNMGLPFYGYGWGTYQGDYTYATIVNTYPGAENSDQIGSGSNMISYNGLKTIRDKTTYAKNNVGGIMIWELSQDVNINDNRSLFRAIKQVLGTSTNIAPTVGLTSPANNSTFTAPATITVSANASDSDGSITSVQFYSGTTLIGTDNTSPYSISWSNVAQGTYSITAKATDNAGATTTSTAVSITVNNQVITQTPYGGTAWVIPGTIEGENYDLGGLGVAYNDVSAANEGGVYRTDAVDIESTTGGGYNVGYIRTDEWMEYTVNVITTGAYNIDARIATTGTGKSFRLELDGSILGTFTLPNTTGWQVWQTVSLNNIALNAGQKILRVYSITGDFNLDKMVFSKVTVANQSPIVNITSPTPGATFTSPATITVSANASDSDGSIASVQFYSGTTLIGTDNTSPFSISWTNVSNGSYSITAKATDNNGATATSTGVSINVTSPVNQLPVVAITSPINNSSYNTPATITINASASDVDGTISKVEFFNGSSKIGEDATVPYSISWVNVPAGTYSITSKATDNVGASSTSIAVNVSVVTVTNDVCANLPEYISTGGNYVAGSKVKNGGHIYECKPWPYSGWCNAAAWAYAPGTGTYWQDAWDDKGSCTPKMGNASINEASEDVISLTPNPASSIIMLNLNKSESMVNIEFLDAYGNSVKQISSIHSGMQVDISSLSSGVYTLRIVGANGIYSRKLVKQ